jgi:hypothetical protein
MEAGADGRTPRNPHLDPSFSLEPVVTYPRRPDRRVMSVVRRSDLAAQASASAHRTGRIRRPVQLFRQSM